MALNSNKDFDAELIENADMMLFAEDVVDNVLLRNCHKYRSEWDAIPFCVHIYKAFLPTIKRAVDYLDNTMESEHDSLFNKIKKGNFINSESYEIFAKTLATEYFSEGFDAKYFLIYCVNLSIMANYFYIYDIIDGPDLAKIHIYQLLQEYNVSDGGWDAIHKIAEHYEKMLLGPPPPDLGLVSYEITHQDQEQEEVIDKSSSSQSVASENPESNLDKQKERACPFCCSNEYQKKYIQYFSKSISEKGLCPFKDLGSSSEDTSLRITYEESKQINRSGSDNEPTPGTSNVDQGLILIISDFKKKMDLLWNEIKNDN